MVKFSMIDMLKQEYDLGRKRSEKPQFYITRHEVAYHASNGKQKSVDKFELYLTLEPGKHSASEMGTYTCTKFYIQLKGGTIVSIPSLAGWSYGFSTQSLDSEGLDAQGLMLGIPHKKFENLTDSTGTKLSIEAQYQVYSAFIYFHSYCIKLAEEESAQSLKKIGDNVVNDLTALESPVNLGSTFLEGSKFLHGIETLEFKGLSVVDGKTCAILGFDEKGGGYVMYIKPMPILKVKTVGGTRVSGDIYIDLESLWVKKVIATVMDMTKTTMFGIPVEISIPITTLTIRSVNKEEFESIE